MSRETTNLIQKILLLVIILILTFDAASMRTRIKALESAPHSCEQAKELSARVDAAEARAKHAVEMADIAMKTANFADEQAFDAKHWVIDEMKKRNVEDAKRLPAPYTYKTFMGGK